MAGPYLNEDEYDDEFRLCYVEGPWAWFTTASLDEQWGDGWDEKPYQYNASIPYHGPHGLGTVAYDGPFHPPGEGPRPAVDGTEAVGGVAVCDMNRAPDPVPWLIQTGGGRVEQEIYAGVGIDEFVDCIHAGNGHVYRAVE